MCKVIAVASQKGGVGKTTTAVNLGAGLVRQGKRVLIIDADAQGSVTACLGISEPDELGYTLMNVMEKVVNDEPYSVRDGILHHEEGLDFLPANIELAALEVSLFNVMSRELVLRQYVNEVRKEYDYILIDCMPTLGIITINALAAADSVLIPVESAYLSVKGLEQLIKTIGKVRRQLNPGLTIEGILITKVDRRTNYAKRIAERLREAYEGQVRIFESCIPLSIKSAEATAEGKSVFLHAPGGIVAKGYEKLAEEVMENDK